MTLESVQIDGVRKPPTKLRGFSKSAIVAVSISLLPACGVGTDARIHRIHELARNPSDPNRNRIAALAQDSDRDVRANALIVLNTVDPSRAQRLARAALGDADGVVRGAAVDVVAPEVAGDLDLAHVLAAMATQDAAWQVRRRALSAIEGIEDPGVKEAFQSALSDSVRHVRRAALEAGLRRPGLLPNERVADLCAKDPDWENRAAAASALAASGDAGALQALALAESDSNEFVRAEATRARRALEKSSSAAASAEPPSPAPAPPPARHDQKPGSGV